MNPAVCRIHFFIYAAGSSPSVFKSKQRKPLSAPCATLPEGESFSVKCKDFLFFRLGFLIETTESVPTRRSISKF